MSLELINKKPYNNTNHEKIIEWFHYINMKIDKIEIAIEAINNTLKADIT